MLPSIQILPHTPADIQYPGVNFWRTQHQDRVLPASAIGHDDFERSIGVGGRESTLRLLRALSARSQRWEERISMPGQYVVSEIQMLRTQHHAPFPESSKLTYNYFPFEHFSPLPYQPTPAYPGQGIRTPGLACSPTLLHGSRYRFQQRRSYTYIPSSTPKWPLSPPSPLPPTERTPRLASLFARSSSLTLRVCEATFFYIGRNTDTEAPSRSLLSRPLGCCCRAAGSVCRSSRRCPFFGPWNQRHCPP